MLNFNDAETALPEGKKVAAPPMRSGKTFFLVNPTSAAGRTRARWLQLLPTIRNGWGSDFSFALTNSPAQVTLIIQKILKSGYRPLIVMGGDGTIHQIVNVLLKNKELNNTSLLLGILNSGSGQGLAKSLQLPEGWKEQLNIIRQGVVQKIDVARIVFIDKQSRLQTRYFVNECQIGIGGEVVRTFQGKMKRLGGTLGFGLAALTAAVRSPAFPLQICFDDSPPKRCSLIGVVIGNGNITGGGMRLTPLAKLTDGKLDVLLIHRQNLLQRLSNFTRIYSGKHIYSSEFSYHRVRKISIEGPAGVPIAADGELLGTLPCHIEVIPGILSVLAPSGGQLS